MRTNHTLNYSDSRTMSDLGDESIDLVVTSPPYPMIEMWDSLFARLNPEAGQALADENGDRAFDIMHEELDKTWCESFRVLKQGGFACINIGDATRTVGRRFQLYSNHSRIIHAFKRIGFDSLPVILWRKQTNSPTKFMGSGTLPAGAYVTLEHEYILVFRKGTKRTFESREEKLLRLRSAFFWEERNRWFSDVWSDLKGVSQHMNHEGLRDRSAAFPFELAYRLIHMYSVQADVLLDPFMGTGTTVIAAIAACRNSIGIEIDEAFQGHVSRDAIGAVQEINKRIAMRFAGHFEFINQYVAEKGALKHVNRNYKFPVVTRQEIEMKIPYVESVTALSANHIHAAYSDELKLTEIVESTHGGPGPTKEEQGQGTLAF